MLVKQTTYLLRSHFVLISYDVLEFLTVLSLLLPVDTELNNRSTNIPNVFISSSFLLNFVWRFETRIVGIQILLIPSQSKPHNPSVLTSLIKTCCYSFSLRLSYKFTSTVHPSTCILSSRVISPVSTSILNFLVIVYLHEFRYPDLFR